MRISVSCPKESTKQLFRNIVKNAASVSLVEWGAIYLIAIYRIIKVSKKQVANVRELVDQDDVNLDDFLGDTGSRSRSTRSMESFWRPAKRIEASERRHFRTFYHFSVVPSCTVALRNESNQEQENVERLEFFWRLLSFRLLPSFTCSF